MYVDITLMKQMAVYCVNLIRVANFSEDKITDPLRLSVSIFKLSSKYISSLLPSLCTRSSLSFVF